MSFSTTHPVDSYCPRRPMSTDEFKTKLGAALDSYYPANKNHLPHYDTVSVLLLLWEDDKLDLDCGREVERLRDVFAKSYGYSTKVLEIPTANTETWLYDSFIDFARDKTARDLVIVYYAGHGDAVKHQSPCLWVSPRKTVTVNVGLHYGPQFGQQSQLYPPPPWATPKQTQVTQTSVDFVKGRDYLCSRPCDVLFLLDCCHAAGAAIGGGKELIAACAVEAKTKAPGYRSFTAALVQELEHAATTGQYLTAAMLYRSLLQKTFSGDLTCSPIHAEFSPASRTSILLIPQGPLSLKSSTPATWPNNIPVSVVLNVHLNDALRNAVDDLTSWLTRSRPSCVEKLKFRTSWESGSRTVVFELAIENWYCLVPDIAISYISFRFHRPAEQATPLPQISRDDAPRPGQGHHRKGQSFGGFRGNLPGTENQPPPGFH